MLKCFARLRDIYRRWKESFDPVTNSVLVTQMEEGRLLRFHIDDITGELDNPCESTVLDVPHRDKEGKPFMAYIGVKAAHEPFTSLSLYSSEIDESLAGPHQLCNT